MTSARITLRHLAFTGQTVEPVTLDFRDGLNIVYGASNTGKSFVSKAVKYMLAGATKLPPIEQLAGREAAWLGLTLPDGRDVTLYRTTRGGAFRLHPGLVMSGNPKAGTALSGKADAKKDSNVSQFLLKLLGLANKMIVEDGNASKEALSIRTLLPYAVISEEDIIAEKSPVLCSGSPTQRTFERNLFKLLLTGVDDASAVTVTPLEQRKVVVTAKVELVDEMVAQLDRELGPQAPHRASVSEQRRLLDVESGSLHDELRSAQMELDRLGGERRQAIDAHRDLVARVAELEITTTRFRRLDDVYQSDVGRLAALEEGGAILASMAERDCPVCGAPPGAQRHKHATQEIALAHEAARAEIAKIEVERRELGLTLRSLEAETGGLRARAREMADEIAILDKAMNDARPKESALRRRYESHAAVKARVDAIEQLYARREELTILRGQIEEATPSKRETALAVGPVETVAYEFGEVVKQVLTAWHFPLAERAQFDLGTNDITIGGKPRAANGKGVRAILHAAFNVAVLMFCRDRSLPHPGFLILDTPLLTFREPMKSRHGALSPDEAALSRTNLASHFYEHLASLKEWGQFIVIENTDPPSTIRSLAHITTFSGDTAQGRFGLFPPLGEPV